MQASNVPVDSTTQQCYKSTARGKTNIQQGFVIYLKYIAIPQVDSLASCPSCLSQESKCRWISLFHYEQRSGSDQPDEA